MRDDRRSRPRVNVLVLELALGFALGFATTHAADSDGDGIDDLVDTCPAVSNPLQVPQTIAPTAVGIGPVFTADESRVVVSNSTELWIATVDGSAAPVNLASLLPGREFRSFEISPDDQWVVYRADRDVLDQFNLYRVPASGGTSVRIDAGLTGTGSFFFSADGSEVFLTADHPTETGVEQLYRVPIAGGVPHMIDTWTSLGLQPVAWPKLTADGTRVLAVDGPAGSSQDRVVSIDLGDESATVLGGGPSINGYRDFMTTADGAQVVFQTTGSDDRLVSVPVGGGTEVPLNGPGETVDTWALTPVHVGGGYRVVWSDRNVGTFGVRLDGGDLLALSTDSPASAGFQFTPDGTRAAYAYGDLITVPVMGGGALTLGTGAESLQAAPDGSRVFFEDVDWNAFPERYRLWSVPFDGSAPALRHDPAPTSGDGVAEYQASPTSDGVLYLLDDLLYWSPADRAGWIEVSTLGSATQHDFAMASDGRRVVYQDGGVLMSRAIEPDLDADGIVETCDCNDLTAGQDPPVAAVDTLGLDPDAGGTRLTWTRPDDADPGDGFTVLRSSSATDYAAGGAIECLVARIDSEQTVDPDTPASGAAYYYVVRVDNGCGPGPLEFDRPAGQSVECQP